ncbi:signal peptidase I [Cerasicoccus arenae]|uniref:Signal peptidase I n=1 Tax=Cerasicoccus arenae TaxID=424488 RepID=A0A8J3DHA2_9BACT|nr:signal peptidase I [Cerasicoccus arenae]MBK1856687.1 signal peptidase I [Cerasicoccus arenae]GHB98909.1 hypothetical protein GCM10007047_13680 [Cerasicoccus arenae]
MFFGNKQKKLRKQARHMLGHAHKVVAYRRDVLSETALAQIAEGRKALESALTSKAADKELKVATDALESMLKKHGGKLYPVTFGSENVEMVIVAAVLAIGVRTYFFQPFKIPTNSMWPTYAGLNATVYPPDEPRPSVGKRFFLGATQGLPQSLPFLFGDFNYYITAPNSGELVIPVRIARTDVGPIAKPVYETFEKMTFGPRFKQIKSVWKKYKVLVGGTLVDVEVPGDFELDDVLVESWFPDYDNPTGTGLTTVLEELQEQGKVSRSSDPSVLLINTGKMLEAGATVLDFNINSGDMLFVDRFSYNFVQPEVGSPIVFRTNNIPGLRTQNSIGQLEPDERYYIKRLVGVAGDELEVKDTTLYRNGAPIEGADAFDKNAQQIEDYPGYQQRMRLTEGKTETIVPGYVYAMGDNSPHSSDSRFWGYGMDDVLRTQAEIEAGVPANMVPEQDVIGRAAFIFYPFSHRWGPAK